MSFDSDLFTPSRPKGVIPTVRRYVGKGRSGAADSAQRSLLEGVLVWFSILFVNGFIGFFVQWLIFSNVSWGDIKLLFTGNLSGAAACYIFIKCILWEVWMVAGLVVVLLVDILKTNISPHWPGHGHISINFDVPATTPTKAPKVKPKTTKGLGPLAQHLAVGAMIFAPGTFNRITALASRARVRFARRPR